MNRDRGQSLVEFALVVPFMLVILLAILDLGRIYVTMTNVESAAREAADYGTTLGAGKWQAGTPMTDTVAEMKRRACVAAQALPDYDDPDNDPANGCANPSFDYCLTTSVGGACLPFDENAGCEIPTRSDPCSVKVTLTHQFRLFTPFRIDLLGVTIGVPATITLQRDSTFAMTDIDLSSPPSGP